MHLRECVKVPVVLVLNQSQCTSRVYKSPVVLVLYKSPVVLVMNRSAPQECIKVLLY